MHYVLACAFGTFALNLSYPYETTCDTSGFKETIEPVGSNRNVVWCLGVCFRVGERYKPGNVWPKATARQAKLISRSPNALAHALDSAFRAREAIKIDQEV